MTPSNERLPRLLLLIPWLARHSGATVEDAAQAMGVDVETLLADLSLISMVGVPPWQPDDLIDALVEDGRVYLHMHAQLSRPPRLLPQEALALLAATEPFASPAAESLNRARAQLLQLLPPERRPQLETLRKRLSPEAARGLDTAPWLHAIAGRLVTRFDYQAAEQSAPQRRDVLPYRLENRDGHWYLGAYCRSRNAQRLFRLDRCGPPTFGPDTFNAAELTQGGEAAPSSPPPGAPSRDAVPIRVRVDGDSAVWARERFGPRASTAAGITTLDFSGYALHWVTSWVLSMGGAATVLEPESLRAQVAEAADQQLRALTRPP